MSIVALSGGLSRGVSNQAERADPLKEGGRQGFAREGMLAADSPFVRKRRAVSVAVLRMFDARNTNNEVPTSGAEIR